ncbi:MAG TPA: TonB-dependent receptor [Candidatus Acidoferrales bacterium]|nr:TonB-dependent receptor [Candidatus Acidoferrales bacterium]
MRLYVRGWSTSLALLTWSGALWAQGVSGRINGTVQDPSQAGIPGATVTVANQDTGYQAEVPTGQSGDYVAPNIPPGKYTVTVSATGFKAAVSKDVVVIVNGVTTVDFTLQIGSRTETVQVDATSQLVDTVTSSMGNDLSTREVMNLPLFGRVYSQLVQIMPGAVKTGIGSSAESGTGIGANGSITAAVNGVVYQGTTFTLDGVSNMELENAFQTITPPIDDIVEVKVSGNNASADVGTYGGAQVNAMIKSGTNQFHGTAFEFYRNRWLNANTWANDLVGAAKPPYLSNQYGGSFGGPVKKNKIFFFTGYEGLQLNNGVTYTMTVPTPMLANGYFPNNFFSKPIYDPSTGSSAGSGTNPTPFPTVTLAGGTYGCSGSGNATTPSCTVYQIPRNRWDPVAAKAIADNTIWPAANAANINAPSNNFTQNLTTTNPQQKFDVKGDFVPRGEDRLFGRVSYQRNDLTTPGPTRFLNVGENASPRDHNDVVGYTHWFNPKSLNEFRFGFNRFYTFHFGNDLGSNENTALGIPNGNLSAFPNTSGIAQMSVNSNQSLGNWQQTGSPGSTNAVRFTNAFDFVDNVSLIHGRHTFGFGGNYRRLQASVTNPDHSLAGSYVFDQSYTSSCANNSLCSGPGGGAGVADFLLGLPTSLTRDIVNTAPETRMTIADVYFQDDLKVTRKLTLNLALRWDLITMYNDVNNHQSNLNINTGLLDIATAGNRAPNVDTNYKNFAPRIGFAYSPDNGRTAIRGAFGITNFPDHYGAAGGTLERNWPWFEEYVLNQQTANTPWAALSSPQNLPNPSCSQNTATCQIGLPAFVNQQYSATVVPSPAASLYYVPKSHQADRAAMWNFGVQRQLTRSSSLDIAYVGTKGTNLFRSINIDQAFPGPNTIVGTGVPASISGLTANRVFSTLGCSVFSATATLSSTGGPVCIAGPLAAIQAINERGSTGYSIYHSLQVRYTKRLSHGLSALLSYTWSKEIDDMTVFVPLLNQDQFNRALGNASAPDVPHLFIGSWVYELPFGKGRTFGGNISKPVDYILGGWQVSGIATIQHGVPLAVTDGTGNNGGLNSGFNNRANYSSSCGSSAPVVNRPNGLSSTQGVQWFDVTCFATHTFNYVYGNSVPGNVWGPGIVNFDLSLSKAVKIHESMELRVRADAFNSSNTPHFNNPGTTCCTAQSAGFGVITGTAPPRQMQLGVHFAF